MIHNYCHAILQHFHVMLYYFVDVTHEIYWNIHSFVFFVQRGVKYPRMLLVLFNNANTFSPLSQHNRLFPSKQAVESMLV